jgi:acyl carrier protein
MRGSLDKDLKTRLKQFIVTECEVEIDIEAINDDDPLFGEESPLALDSIDGFQLAVAIQNTYGIKITDSKELQKILRSINTFADFLQPA